MVKLAVWSCLLLAVVGLSAETRYHQYTRAYENPPNPAAVVVAGYLGGAGTEWLVGGGLLPDGRIVVCGNAWGPKLELPGVSVTVLGRDTQPGQAPAQRKDRKGKTVPYSYADLTGAGWVAILAPDGKKVLQAVRLPWRSGTANAAVVDDAGGIYLAGRCGEEWAAIGAPTAAANYAEHHDASASNGFLLKIAPDLSGVEWTRTVQENSKAAQLRIGPRGGIQLHLTHVHVFADDGFCLKHAICGEENNWAIGYDPKTLAKSTGYFHKHHTGREPWHRPFLSLGRPDGSFTQLWQFHGHLVGHDRYRLVSDSKVLNLHYGDDGYLYVGGWSDGGNTVYQRKAYDIATPHGKKGLGFSAWGAGAMSLAHVTKLDPKTCETVNYTLWCGFLSGRQAPSSAKIVSMTTTKTGELVLAGGASWGLIQTGNKLSECQPAGSYISVLQKDFRSLRFSSALPATGKIALAHNRKWRSASAIVGDRSRLLMVGSGVAYAQVYSEDKWPAPCTSGAVQQKFGGGHSDGWFLVLDLGTKD